MAVSYQLTELVLLYPISVSQAPQQDTIREHVPEVEHGHAYESTDEQVQDVLRLILLVQ